MTLTDKNRELNALISLLDEPDADIFVQVREKLFSYGTQAISALESAWDHSFDGTIQKRIENIIHEIQLKNLYTELADWRKNHTGDLLKGFILVSKYQYPDLDEQKIIKQMGSVIQDVWLELNQNLTPLEKTRVINHILFDVHKFTGNKTNLHAPQNSFLKDILDTKKANPISLSIIYLIVAQSLHVPVYGINLPQNFIMCYTDRMFHKDFKFTRDDVQFYINAFNKGAVFTRREVELFIRQLKLKDEDTYYTPCENVEILFRVFNNLIFAYEGSGNPEKVQEIRWIQKALK
jgi:regulator of sirC expression with transglutaminase-like and TPR domain